MSIEFKSLINKRPRQLSLFDRRLLLFISVSAYLVMWIGGVCSYLFSDGPPANAEWTAPVFLLLAGIVVIISGPLDLLALLAISSLGFLAEAIGIRYKFLFGSYSYTDT